MPKDTRTRAQGVYARHKLACATETDGRCDCQPSYWGKVYDRTSGRHLKTTMLPSVSAARDARADLATAVKAGTVPVRSGVRVSEAVERFLRAAREGVALNKQGRRYKRKALADIEGSLNAHVVARIGTRRLTDVRRANIQAIVDDIAPTLSGSRVRSVVNSIHSLYRWAQDRELAQHDPAQHVRLPAMNATRRDRVAGPAEMTQLLDALDERDALPYALAAYATARLEEVRRLRWEDVDLGLGVVYLGRDELEARKSVAALRAVPLVRTFWARLRATHLAQGRPSEGLVCPGIKPRAKHEGLLSSGGLATRATKAWDDKKLKRITLHECRHTAASYMNAAGVNPKVMSELMGHAIPTARLDGAARITLERYTHVLPGALEVAREQLDRYLIEAAHQQRATARSQKISVPRPVP
jgi:integrase